MPTPPVVSTAPSPIVPLAAVPTQFEATQLVVAQAA